MSSGEAIARVAQEIREQHQGAHVAVLFDDEDEQQDAAPEASRDDDAEEDEDY